MSDLIKKARRLCKARLGPKGLRKRVPRVTMLTVVVDEKKRREYLNRAKVMLTRNSR
jgi:hypothetical protein